MGSGVPQAGKSPLFTIRGVADSMKLPRSKIRHQRFHRKVKKRVAKKMVARMGSWAWKQLTLATSLIEGDVIHTCKGYSQVIEKIEPVAWFTKKGWVIYDVDFTLEDGGSCSLQHCCTLPLPPKEELLYNWRVWANAPKTDWDFGDQHNKLIKAIRDGEDPFEDNGCIKKEYKVNYNESNGGSNISS